MGTDRPHRRRRSDRFGGVSADLVAIVAVTALVAVAPFVPGLRETSLRTAIALAFVFFVPGYAAVSALFPGRTTSNATAEGRGLEVDGFARVVLSIGLSISIVPLIALVLVVTPWGVALVPLALAAALVTLLATTVAAVRRRRLPEAQRYRVPVGEWLATGRAGVFETERTDAVLNVVLAVAILFGTASLGYAVVAPQHAEEHSTITILTEEGGELVTDDYPTDLEPGESEELVVAIDNHEQETTSYTVVVVEQELESSDDESVVTDQRELDRFEMQVDQGETEHRSHDLAPTTTGEDTRIAWLLYADDVPEEPSTDTADQYVHLWMDGGES